MKLRIYLLLLFFALATAPVMLMRFWPHSTAFQVEVAEVRGRHLLLAQNLANSLTRYHRDLTATFELLLREPTIWDADGGRAGDILDNLSFRHMCLVEPVTGRVVSEISPSDAPCPERISVDVLAYFLARSSRENIAFGPVRGMPDGRNVMHMARMEADHLAISEIETDYFQELGRSVSFGILGHAAIVDHQGNVLSHPLDDWVATRRNIIKVSTVARMLAGDSGIETFYSPALNADMIAGFAPVPGPGWGVMVPQPISELKAKAETIRTSTLIVLALGLGIAMSLAMIFSVLVARPLERISAASRDISEGRLTTAQPPTVSPILPLEFRELHRNFCNMIARLNRSSRRINELAFRDSVTGLANREWFNRHLDKIMARGDAGDVGSLLFFDLDGFKAVNDAFGHDVGDEVLRQVAERLTEIFGSQELDVLLEHHTDPLSEPLPSVLRPVLSRLGGDEFAVYVPMSHSSDIDGLSKDVLTAMGRKFHASGHVISIGCSIGIASFPSSADTYRMLLKSADIAMYSAKNSGKNRICHFTQELRRRTASRDALADEMRLAIKCNEFVPDFQPQFCARTLQVQAVEALARWKHPSRGVLGTGEFLEIGYEIGLIGEIDRMIAAAAVGTMEEIVRLAGQAPDLSINVSADRLTDRGLLDHAKVLSGLPFNVHFELVESIYCDELDDLTAWTLEQLDAQGIGIELDDFGSGHASIRALLALRPRMLKIDGQLIQRIDTDPEHRNLVRTIIDMGSALGIGVTAECVERDAQLRILQEIGCDRVQGRLLAPPMPAWEFVSFCVDREESGTVQA